MSILDYIALGVIAAGLAVMVVIIMRKFPLIAAIKTDSIPEHIQKEVKKDLIERRLTRKMEEIVKKTGITLKPLAKKTGEFFHGTYKKIIELENQYSQKVNKTPKDSDQGRIKNKVTQLLEEAENLVKQNKHKEAEKKYIEIIALEKDNLTAFTRLGELYLEMKEYDYAHETFSHLLRIDPDNAMVYHDLGLLAEKQGNPLLSVKNFQKALQLEPNNPKILDSLLETCLGIKNKVMAWECLDKLKEVNPENQKIQEFEARVKTLEKELKIKK